MLKRLTKYLVFPEFVGPSIDALNGILSGLKFFIDLIHSGHEQKLMSCLILLFFYHHLHSKLSC